MLGTGLLHRLHFYPQGKKEADSLPSKRDAAFDGTHCHSSGNGISVCVLYGTFPALLPNVRRAHAARIKGELLLRKIIHLLLHQLLYASILYINFHNTYDQQ